MMNWRWQPVAGSSLDVRPVAYDAFVFLFSAKNPVAGLSVEQIRDIYSGRITNWRDVGGPYAPIQPYQRTRNSGSQELMEKLVMKGRAMLAAPDLLTGAIMSWPTCAGQGRPWDRLFGVLLPGIHAPRADVKACAVDGVLPTSASIRSRRYPFITEVDVVVRRNLRPNIRLVACGTGC